MFFYKLGPILVLFKQLIEVQMRETQIIITPPMIDVPITMKIDGCEYKLTVELPITDHPVLISPDGHATLNVMHHIETIAPPYRTAIADAFRLAYPKELGTTKGFPFGKRSHFTSAFDKDSNYCIIDNVDSVEKEREKLMRNYIADIKKQKGIRTLSFQELPKELSEAFLEPHCKSSFRPSVNSQDYGMGIWVNPAYGSLVENPNTANLKGHAHTYQVTNNNQTSSFTVLHGDYNDRQNTLLFIEGQAQRGHVVMGDGNFTFGNMEQGLTPWGNELKKSDAQRAQTGAIRFTIPGETTIPGTTKTHSISVKLNTSDLCITPESSTLYPQRKTPAELAKLPHEKKQLREVMESLDNKLSEFYNLEEEGQTLTEEDRLLKTYIKKIDVFASGLCDEQLIHPTIFIDQYTAYKDAKEAYQAAVLENERLPELKKAEDAIEKIMNAQYPVLQNINRTQAFNMLSTTSTVNVKQNEPNTLILPGELKNLGIKVDKQKGTYSGKTAIEHTAKAAVLTTLSSAISAYVTALETGNTSTFQAEKDKYIAAKTNNPKYTHKPTSFLPLFSKKGETETLTDEADELFEKADNLLPKQPAQGNQNGAAVASAAAGVVVRQAGNTPK